MDKKYLFGVMASMFLFSIAGVYAGSYGYSGSANPEQFNYMNNYYSNSGQYSSANNYGYSTINSGQFNCMNSDEVKTFYAPGFTCSRKTIRIQNNRFLYNSPTGSVNYMHSQGDYVNNPEFCNENMNGCGYHGYQVYWN